jgi:hypothetical protein
VAPKIVQKAQAHATVVDTKDVGKTVVQAATTEAGTTKDVVPKGATKAIVLKVVTKAAAPKAVIKDIAAKAVMAAVPKGATKVAAPKADINHAKIVAAATLARTKADTPKRNIDIFNRRTSSTVEQVFKVLFFAKEY